jgi:hypothetical protein
MTSRTYWQEHVFDGWMEGRLSDGRQGLFPANFVKLLPVEVKKNPETYVLSGPYAIHLPAASLHTTSEMRIVCMDGAHRIAGSRRYTGCLRHTGKQVRPRL